MDRVVPVGIRSESSRRTLEIDWAEGQGSVISWALLRASCPCAQCRDGSMPLGASDSDEAVMVVDIIMTGRYGIQPVWGDGHDTGIFTWEYLMTLKMNHSDSSAGGNSDG